MKHQIIDYLNVDSLTPDASEMGAIANSDWWTACSSMFDDLLWLYYPNRTVFFNDRFPFNPNDPENAADIASCIANIKRTFAVYLKSKNYTYSRLYNTTVAEYNPLYNVDAYEFEDTISDHTGTNENEKSGSDTNVKSGDTTVDYLGEESVIKSGNETIENEGSEENVRSGSEDLSHDGVDTTTNSRTTFDSSTEYETDKSEVEPGVTDTTTYNNVTDTRNFIDRVDTHTYNDVTDTKSYDERSDKTSYNDVTDEMTYNSKNTETRNLHDVEGVTRRRYGNIGVTKSTDLIDAERETVLYDFYKKVVHDCVNLITYAVI